MQDAPTSPPSSLAEPEDVFNAKEAARFTRMGDRLFGRRVHEGWFSYTQVGEGKTSLTRVFLREDLLAGLRAHRTAARHESTTKKLRAVGSE